MCGRRCAAGPVGLITCDARDRQSVAQALLVVVDHAWAGPTGPDARVLANRSPSPGGTHAQNPDRRRRPVRAAAWPEAAAPKGYEVSIMSARTPEEIRTGWPTSTQGMFHQALETELAYGLNFRDDEAPPIDDPVPHGDLRLTRALAASAQS